MRARKLRWRDSASSKPPIWKRLTGWSRIRRARGLAGPSKYGQSVRSTRMQRWCDSDQLKVTETEYARPNHADLRGGVRRRRAAGDCRGATSPARAGRFTDADRMET